MAEYQSYMEAPRWAGFKQYLWDLSSAFKLKLTIIDHDKGWIRETIYWKWSGEKKNITNALNQLRFDVRSWNNPEQED